MDPSNSNLELLNVKVTDIIRIGSPENDKTVKLCTTVVEQLIEELKPILKYVCTPRDLYDGKSEGRIIGGEVSPKKITIHCILIGDSSKVKSLGERVYLENDGKFFEVLDTYPDNREVIYHPSPSKYAAWMNVPFSVLLEALHGALKTARRKREEFLKSIKKREELLESILTTIREHK